MREYPDPSDPWDRFLDTEQWDQMILDASRLDELAVADELVAPTLGGPDMLRMKKVEP